MMVYISPRLTGVMLTCFPPTIIGAILIGRHGGQALARHPGRTGPVGQRRRGGVPGHRQREGLLQRALRAKRYEARITSF
jgi:hypothetical protein